MIKSHEQFQLIAEFCYRYYTSKLSQSRLGSKHYTFYQLWPQYHHTSIYIITYTKSLTISAWNSVAPWQVFSFPHETFSGIHTGALLLAPRLQSLIILTFLIHMKFCLRAFLSWFWTKIESSEKFAEPKNYWLAKAKCLSIYIYQRVDGKKDRLKIFEQYMLNINFTKNILPDTSTEAAALPCEIIELEGDRFRGTIDIAGRSPSPFGSRSKLEGT